MVLPPLTRVPPRRRSGAPPRLVDLALAGAGAARVAVAVGGPPALGLVRGLAVRGGLVQSVEMGERRAPVPLRLRRVHGVFSPVASLACPRHSLVKWQANAKPVQTSKEDNTGYIFCQ